MEMSAGGVSRDFVRLRVYVKEEQGCSAADAEQEMTVVVPGKSDGN